MPGIDWRPYDKQVWRSCMNAVWLMVGLLTTVGFGTARAQGAGTVLLLRVGDASTGAFVQGAYVFLPTAGLATRTDSMGEARIPAVPAGPHSLEVRRLGYAPLQLDAVFSGRDSTEVVMMLRPIPHSLESVAVTEERTPAHLREFETRRRSHIGGHFITEADLDEYFGLSLQAVFARRIPALRALTGLEGSTVVARWGADTLQPACVVPVYLDGFRLANGDATLLPLTWIAGMEYYSPGTVPPQYRAPAARGYRSGEFGGGSATCGVLLIWTKP